MKGNNQKTSDKERQQDEKDGALDQIKKKYGFSSSSYVRIYLSYAFSSCLTFLPHNSSQAWHYMCLFTSESCCLGPIANF